MGGGSRASKDRNKETKHNALTLAHAQTIHYTASNSAATPYATIAACAVCCGAADIFTYIHSN